MTAGLALRGVAPRSLIDAANPLSPSGMKPKSKIGLYGMPATKLWADDDSDDDDSDDDDSDDDDSDDDDSMASIDQARGGRGQDVEDTPVNSKPVGNAPVGGGGGKDRGVALRWFQEKGFGFIKPHDGGDNLFCHFSCITDGSMLREGSEVSYNKVFDERKGKGYKAEQVVGGIRDPVGKSKPVDYSKPSLTSACLITEPVKRAVIEAGNAAFRGYLSKPYLEMPASYKGDPYDYYMDWEPFDYETNGELLFIERPNHGLANAIRKATLVPAVCKAQNFDIADAPMIGMCVAMVFEVAGRESEIGFRDDPATYMRYRQKSIRAFKQYAEKFPWYNEVLVKALENMYHEPHPDYAGKVQQVYEIVHDLELFRCSDVGEMRPKLSAIKRSVGSKAFYELVLRAENQIVATGDMLMFSMMGNQVRDDYDEQLFPRCSKDAAVCLEKISSMPLLPPLVAQAQQSASSKPVPPAAPTAANPPATAPTLANTGAKCKTFKESLYLRVYTKAKVPIFQDELMGAVRKLVTWYVKQAGLQDHLVKDYFQRVQRNAFKAGDNEAFSDTSVPFIAIRMWTTAETINGVELCGMLNKAVREDVPEVMEAVAVIARAMNFHCVARGPSKLIAWPSESTTYRGSALPQCHRAFFTQMFKQGTKYRVPMYLATSADDEVAENRFLARLEEPSGRQQPPHQEPVMWIFHFDPVKRCKNINFIDKARSSRVMPSPWLFPSLTDPASTRSPEQTDDTVSGESEFLFPPYSTFTVRSVEWVSQPVWNDIQKIGHHTIHVDVEPDNGKCPLDVPLAPWA